MIRDVLVGGLGVLAMLCLLRVLFGAMLEALFGREDAKRFTDVDTLAEKKRAARADHHELAEAAVMEAAAWDHSLSRSDCQRIYEETAETLELAEPTTLQCIDCGRNLKPTETFTCLRCYVANKS